MSRREMILKIASQKLRRFGYNGFSYADIAKEVGITTASLHYHFPSKEDLAIALCTLIQETWQETLQSIKSDENTLSALDQLHTFILTNIKTLQSQEICPIVAFISNYESLPDRVKEAVFHFSEFEYQLIQCLIDKAIKNGELSDTIDNDQYTVQIISLIKGALIYRRIQRLPTNDFNNIAKLLENLLSAWRRISNE